MSWKIGSDQLLKVTGLIDPITSTYVNAATITATMYEADGTTEVAGQSWPLTLGYVSGSDGDYRGILDDSRVLVEGRIYWIDVTIDAGGDAIKLRRWSDVAAYEGATT